MGESVRRTGGMRSSAVRFFVCFVLYALVLLATCRYAVGTPAMNGYLYFVARHTACVLSLTGYSCRLEDPNMYRGREATVRHELAAWRQGQDPAPDPKVTTEKKAPLTSREVWEYRAWRKRHALRLAKGRLSLLHSPVSGVIDSPEGHVAYVRRRLAMVQNAIHGPGGDGPVMGPADTIRAADETGLALDAMAERTDMAPDTFGAAMKQLEIKVEEARLAQTTYLEQRVVQLSEQVSKLGPSVSFVAKASVARRIGDSERRLASLASDAPSAERDALTARLERLKREQDAQKETGAPDEERAFRFHLVADCGALESIAIFVAAVLAFPARWRARWLGLALGVPALYAINVGRLVCLAHIGAWDSHREWFDFAHKYVWQGIYLVFVVAIWLLWFELLAKRQTEPGVESEA